MNVMSIQGFATKYILIVQHNSKLNFTLNKNWQSHCDLTCWCGNTLFTSSVHHGMAVVMTMYSSTCTTGKPACVFAGFRHHGQGYKCHCHWMVVQHHPPHHLNAQEMLGCTEAKSVNTEEMPDCLLAMLVSTLETPDYLLGMLVSKLGMPDCLSATLVNRLETQDCPLEM